MQTPLSSLDFCTKHFNEKKGMYSAQFSWGMTEMAEHAQGVMETTRFKHELMRAFIYDYIRTGNDIATKQATHEFGLESIPEAEEEDMNIIKNRIHGADQDMLHIQEIMFSVPIQFTPQQAWELATVLIAHQRDDSIRQRAISRRNMAVMMATHARLGAGSSLNELDSLILCDIIERSMQR